MHVYNVFCLSYIEPVYVKYEKNGKKNWECDEKIKPETEYSTFPDAVSACNANPKCLFIEQDDCKDKMFKLCDREKIKEDDKDCVYEKKGLSK